MYSLKKIIDKNYNKKWLKYTISFYLWLISVFTDNDQSFIKHFKNVYVEKKH